MGRMGQKDFLKIIYPIEMLVYLQTKYTLDWTSSFKDHFRKIPKYHVNGSQTEVGQDIFDEVYITLH